MHRSRVYQGFPVFAGILLALSGPVLAQDAGQAEFQRGYFLQNHDKDLAKAAAAYQEVVGNAGAPEKLRNEARLRLEQCQEDLASADFARLMPAEAMAYVEISEPGEHVNRLVRMLGLVREPTAAPVATKTGATPLGEGFFFPEDFTISPALVAALSAFRGAAVAITGFDPHRGPDGVLVVHPGNADLIRGLLETAVQVSEPADPIEGFKCYRVQGEAWVAVSRRLFFVGRSREQVAAAVSRLKNPEADSLARRDDFKALQADRENALLFAYVNGPRVNQIARQMIRGQEAMMAQALLDLDHIQAVSVAARTSNEGLEFKARLDLMQGHRNLVYGMIRTAPFSRRSLENVPAGAAAVVLIGLNPPTSPGSAASTAQAANEFPTAMDIGREFFANVEEIAVFVTPPAPGGSTAGMPIPDIGLVLVAKDAAKSQAVWGQLLALPSMFMPGQATASETTIAGRKATEYRFPDVPPIVLVQAQERAIVIGTPGAATAAAQTTAEKGSILGDAGFKPLLDRLTPSSSKAVLVHAGRATEMAAGFAHGPEQQQFRLAASILNNLRIALVTDEQPTQFSVRGELTGLPNVPDAVRKLAALMQPAARVTHRSEATATETVAHP